jgi:hypothetical protein
MLWLRSDLDFCIGRTFCQCARPRKGSRTLLCLTGIRFGSVPLFALGYDLMIMRNNAKSLNCVQP